MKGGPLVSIIIPAYNADQYIAKTIRSAIAQTWDNKEIIVVNDGSTDSTLQIAEDFGNVSVKVISQANKGAAAARNSGLQEAKGDYIQFLDADDLLKNNKIELQLNALKNSSEAIAYGSYIDFFDGDNKEKKTVNSYLHTDYLNGKDLLYDLYGGGDIKHAGGMVPQHSWLVPRAVINTAGNWNTSLTVDDDGEFFCRVVLSSAGAKYVKDSICYYRKHSHRVNLSAQKSYRSYESAFNAIKLKQQYIGNDSSLNTLLANQAMHLLCSAYPKYPVLYKQIQQFINEMGGCTWLPYQEGAHKVFRKLFGWKTVRLLSYYKNS